MSQKVNVYVVTSGDYDDYHEVAVNQMVQSALTTWEENLL